jgi:hypothetical protein
MRELESFKTNGVFRVMRSSDVDLRTVRPLRCSFVYEWKVIDGVRDIKARLCARGMPFLDYRKDLDTSTATPPLHAFRMLLAWVVQRPDFTPDDIMSADVKTAFLQSPFVGDQRVYLRPSRELCEALGIDCDSLLELLKAMYGIQDAPRLFERFFIQNVMQPLGWKPTVFEHVYVRYTSCGRVDGLVYAHVDDILAVSGVTTARAILEEIGTRVQLKSPPAVPKRLIGMDMHVSLDGVVVNQRLLAMSLDVPDCEKRWNSPLPLNIGREERHIESSPPLSPERAQRYRSLRGSLGYLQHTRMDLCFAISYLGRFNQAPTERAERLLVQACQYAKQNAQYGISYPSLRARKASGSFERPADASACTFDAYADASFGRVCMTGILITFNGMVVYFRSSKQRKVCASTVKAECVALYDSVVMLVLFLYFAYQLRMKCKPTQWSDAHNLVDLLMSEHPRPAEASMIVKLRELQAIMDGDPEFRADCILPQRSLKQRGQDEENMYVNACALRDLLSDCEHVFIPIEHVRGTVNPADPFTKSLDAAYLISHYMHTPVHARRLEVLHARECLLPSSKSVRVADNDRISDSSSDSSSDSDSGSITFTYNCPMDCINQHAAASTGPSLVPVPTDTHVSPSVIPVSTSPTVEPYVMRLRDRSKLVKQSVPAKFR